MKFKNEQDPLYNYWSNIIVKLEQIKSEDNIDEIQNLKDDILENVEKLVDGYCEKQIDKANQVNRVVMPKIAEVTAYTTEQQLVMALGTVEKQKKIISEVYQLLQEAPELNPSNYTHDQACELNNKMIEAYGIINESNFSE